MNLLSSALQIHVGTMEGVLGVVVVLFAVGVAWGQLRKTVGHLDGTLRHRVLPDLRDVRERIARIEGKLDAFWSSHESRQVTKRSRTPNPSAKAR